MVNGGAIPSREAALLSVFKGKFPPRAIKLQHGTTDVGGGEYFPKFGRVSTSLVQGTTQDGETVEVV